MRILVTREFDTQHVIGYLTLHDDIELSPDYELAFSFRVEPATETTPERKRVQSVSLIAKPVMPHFTHEDAKHILEPYMMKESL